MATINVDESTKTDLKKFCQKHRLTQGDFVKHALAYFRKSGIDPSDPPESVKEELSKMEKRISQSIAFQRSFEKERLNPLLNDIIEATQRMKSATPAPAEPQEDIKKLTSRIEGLHNIMQAGLLGVILQKREDLEQCFTMIDLKRELEQMRRIIYEQVLYGSGITEDAVKAKADSDRAFRKALALTDTGKLLNID